MAKPDIFIFFCEDTREEVGNKMSIMGLLGPKMLFEADEIVMKSLTIGALCRFREPGPVNGTFSVTFTSDRSNVPLPPALKNVFELPAQEEAVWTTQIVGSLGPLPVHAGMKVKAKLVIGKTRHEAEMCIERGVP